MIFFKRTLLQSKKACNVIVYIGSREVNAEPGVNESPRYEVLSQLEIFIDISRPEAGAVAGLAGSHRALCNHGALWRVFCTFHPSQITFRET